MSGARTVRLDTKSKAGDNCISGATTRACDIRSRQLLCNLRHRQGLVKIANAYLVSMDMDMDMDKS